MVDEIQRQRQMMTTDPNRQHYGPAGGPNRWTMDHPAGGMPTNYRGHSPHFRSGNLDVRYPGDFNAQQNQGRPNVSGPAGGPRTFRNTYPVTDFYGPPSEAEEMYWQGGPKQHPNPRMRGMMGGLGGLQEQAAVDPSDWRTILRILEAGGDPGTETAGLEEGIMGALPGEYETAGLYQQWKKIASKFGEAYANNWLASQQAV